MIKKHCLLLIVLVIICFACTDYTPKPYGYFRIKMNDHNYKEFPDDASFSFLMSSDAKIDPVIDPVEGEWFDIIYPAFNAKIHCSYLPVTPSKFPDAAEDSRKFVYRHAVKADAINDVVYSNPEKDVYGIIYEVKGNVASPVQFILTDSTKHFFRGALYFDCIPNQDSLAPVISYLQKDIEQIITSFHWKNN